MNAKEIHISKRLLHEQLNYLNERINCNPGHLLVLKLCEIDAKKLQDKLDRLQARSEMLEKVVDTYEWKGMHSPECRCLTCRKHRETLAEARQAIKETK